MLLGGLAATLALAALARVGPTRMTLFAAAGGLGPFLLVRRRWGVSDLLMVPLATSALLWAVLATILTLSHSPLPALAAWAPAFIAAGLAIVAWRQGRQIELVLSPLDAAPLLAAGLAAIPILAVFAHNGPQGDRYVAHSWFNLDSFYFFALAQESVERGGWPDENPFLAGVPNYYPSFLHVGLGALATQGGPTVAICLAWLTPFFLIASVGLWVAACMRAAEARSFAAAATTSGIALLGVAGAVGLRPDLFIYPHTQSFAFGWLALLVWLAAAEPLDPASTIAAGVVALALVLAHTITGAAALVFAAGTSLRLLLTRETRRQGLFVAAGGLALALVFWRVNALPYSGLRGPFALSSFSRTGPALQPWLWPMVGLATAVAASWRRPARALPALGTVALGAAYCLYGTMQMDPAEGRFVVFNAVRFFHLGLLLALPPALRGDRRIGLAAVLLVAVSAAWHPSDLARASRSLIDDTPIVVDASELALFERVRHELPVDARILYATPEPRPDLSFPAFTGRAESPIGRNIWGLNTLPASEFDQRRRDALAFPTLPSDQWRAVLDRWRYSHVLLRIVVPPEIDPASAPRWVEAQLPPGELVVQMAAGNLFLLARRADPAPLAGP